MMRTIHQALYALIVFNIIPKFDMVFDITKSDLLVTPHLEGQWITIHPYTFLERILKYLLNYPKSEHHHI